MKITFGKLNTFNERSIYSAYHDIWGDLKKISEKYNVDIIVLSDMTLKAQSKANDEESEKAANEEINILCKEFITKKFKDIFTL